MKIDSTFVLTPPEPTERSPYYSRYATLQEQAQQMKTMLSVVNEERANFRYAPDKGSLKQVVGHVSDTERIFAYRALRISRNDKTPIEGLEQDDYVRYGGFENCELGQLVEDYLAVRDATVSLFRNLDSAVWTHRGIANKNEVTVRAIAYIIAGHELCHQQVLNNQ